MARHPERPFIPTPASTPRGTTAPAAAFQLTRPFVHGMSTSSAVAEAVSGLPSIEEFLHRAEVEPESYTSPGDALDFSGEAELPQELPPVEHFLDPLPLVEALAPDGGDALFADSAEPTATTDETGSYAMEESEVFGLEDTGWVDTGWQQFDWSGAGALGEGSAEASDAWQRTDWETTAPPVREFRETAAQAIANALDQIANRIRNGELVVPSPDVVANPAAIAATLAALLGVRR